MELKNDLFKVLIKQADHFCCAIEMAAYLAMMMQGGPKRCFLWHCDAQGKLFDNATPGKKFQESLESCPDDLALALLLLKMFQSYSTDEERERWCRQWQVNYAALLSVDLVMDRLLGEYCSLRDSSECTRPIDLRLIDKVRLLMVHHFASCEHTSLEECGGFAMQGRIYRSTSQQPVRIHCDSVCYKRKTGLKNSLYFFSAQEEGHKEIEVKQVIQIPEWCPDELFVGKLDASDLAYLIVKQTRLGNRVEVRSRWEMGSGGKPGKQSSQLRHVFLGEDLSALIQPLATEERGNMAKEVIMVRKHAGYCGKSGLTGQLGEEALQRGETYEGTVVRILPHPYNYALVRVRSGQHGFLYAFDGEKPDDIYTGERIHVGKNVKVRLHHRSAGKRRIYFHLVANESRVDLKERAIVREVSPKEARVCLASGEFAILCEAKVDGRPVQDMSKAFSVDDEILVKIMEPGEGHVPINDRRTIYVSADKYTERKS